MHVTLVQVNVKHENITEFIEATKINHEASIQEPGNIRFDILQSPDNKTHFILYEAYDSNESATRHKQTHHYLNWRETVAPWMASPRQGTIYDGLFPSGK